MTVGKYSVVHAADVFKGELCETPEEARTNLVCSWLSVTPRTRQESIRTAMEEAAQVLLGKGIVMSCDTTPEETIQIMLN